MDTQAIYVTFDFKGTRVRWFVSGSTDYQIIFKHKMFLNDHSWFVNLNEMRLYIWSWQTLK